MLHPNGSQRIPVAPPSPAAFQILLALADGEKHGYAIMQEIVQRTEGMVRLGPGTLYRTIKHLLEAGWITESDERPDPERDDERRRYYRVSAYGQQVARAEVERLTVLVRSAQRKLAIEGRAI
ncbi:MAG: PadR family transcriptional regulator [Thermomicrobiales bacterium]